MRRILLLIFATILVSFSATASEWLVLLNPATQHANSGAPMYNRMLVTSYLKQTLHDSFSEFQTECLQTLDPAIQIKQKHWINRSVLIQASEQDVKILKTCPQVYSIQPNAKVITAALLKPVLQNELAATIDLPWSSVLVGLDKVRQIFPNLLGQGVLIGEMDTGVDGTHPALVGKIQRFYNGKKKVETAATDRGGHGTHVAGILVGADFQGHTIGIAPQAKLIASAGLDDINSMFNTMEWMLTIPGLRVVNNSWAVTVGQDPTPLYRAIESWDAAGILAVFSAGNGGPRVQSITIPHEHPLTIAVAGVIENGHIFPESSRGPAIYLGQTTQKPDLAAPGDMIFSSFPYNRSGLLSGTSVAAPHVTAAVALMLQVCPHLTTQQLREILRTNQLRMWSPDFGFGTLDIYKFILQAQSVCPSDNPRTEDVFILN